MLYGQGGVGLSIEQDGKPHSGQHPWWALFFLCQQSQGWVTGEGRGRGIGSGWRMSEQSHFGAMKRKKLEIKSAGRGRAHVT